MAERPAYARLADELMQAIVDGRHEVGTLLPPELELAAAHGLSRSTVRAALSRLEQLGLVTRQKAVGTRVQARRATDYSASITSIETLLHFGAATIRQVQKVEPVVADDDLAQALSCRPGLRWHRVAALRVSPEPDNAPICWTDSYIDPTYATVIEELASSQRLITDLIADRFGVLVDEVRQVIRPTLLPASISTPLHVEVGAPALQATRHYLSVGCVTHVSISHYAGHNAEYKMSLLRTGAVVS